MYTGLHSEILPFCCCNLLYIHLYLCITLLQTGLFCVMLSWTLPCQLYALLLQWHKATALLSESTPRLLAVA